MFDSDVNIVPFYEIILLGYVNLLNFKLNDAFRFFPKTIFLHTSIILTQIFLENGRQVK